MYVSFSQDGTMLSTVGSCDNTSKVWKLDTGTDPTWRQIFSARGGVYCAQVSPDGKKVAATTSSTAGTVKIWSVQSGKLLRELKGHKGEAYFAAWSPDSKLLASSGKDDTVRVWDVDTGKQALETLTGHMSLVTCMVFGATRPVLASCCGYMIIIWERQQLGRIVTVMQRLELLTHSEHISLSPDDSRLASWGRDGKIRVWDVSTGQPISAISDIVHSRVQDIAWTPDCKHIRYAVSAGSTVRVWRAGAKVYVLTFMCRQIRENM